MLPSSSIPHEQYRTLIDGLLHRLFPLCRSITGDGVRETLRILGETVPMEIVEIPSGTPVFDWEVPYEWNIRDAWIKDAQGNRVVDFTTCNLHVVNYSIPVRQTMTLQELRPYLHALPEQPNAIPYLTTYYKRDWGFCLAQEQLDALSEGEYDVCIDSVLEPGSLTLAECVLPGESEDEILFSTYCCHPSMANNELSGPIMATALYAYLSGLEKRHYTYRFCWVPETIGALAYLHLRGEHLKRQVKAGFQLTCCGDSGAFTYKKVRNPHNIVDRIVLHVLRHTNKEHGVVEFFPTGSDERQYSSPGFNLPVGSLMRTMYGTNPEYHTSLDNLEFVTADSMLETLEAYINVLYCLEHNVLLENLKPFGEPFLSKYDLYHSLGGQKQQRDYTRKLRYILNFSDGENDLLDIAERLDVPLWGLEGCVSDLQEVGLAVVGRHSSVARYTQQFAGAKA